MIIIEYMYVCMIIKDRITPQKSTSSSIRGTGNEGKTKEVVEDREVTKSCVCVCDKVVCERWCVTKKGVRVYDEVV